MSKAKWNYDYEYNREWLAEIAGPYGQWCRTPYSIVVPDENGMFTVYTDGDEPTEHETLREAKGEVERRHAARKGETNDYK